MKIIENNLVKVFRKDFNNKAYYRIGISKKDKDGNYENGYLDVRFRKDVELEDRANIYIKDAWISFYLKEEKTVPFIFINEFETVEQTIERIHEENEQEITNPKEMIINPEDLPF